MARLLILLLVLALTVSIAESRIRYRPPYRPTIHQWFWGRTGCADWQSAVRNNSFRVIKRGVLQNIEYVRPKDCPFPRRK
ncbi:hypothetical protein PRIPAC_97483 [Pristionchus pacificus]|uniref:Uncharacterized protein n=1 Tax=Pristionchus pacificus TaxID=54126 RepID=A0A2A6CUA6_PRIPA|nr:hypothetical protein PRIPAC_97483 [Pristionchus pacificus]|eukprot:PDM81623.1 hypothetical protein PRIPAC_30604 [Pristionchus pacificus]